MAALICAGLTLPAQEPPPLQADQASRLWRTEDGLPRDTVTALLEAQDGFLWIGTEAGVVRFDGRRFHAVPGAGDLRGITCLAETPDGSIWVGTSGPGLHRLRRGVLTPFGTTQGLPDHRILALHRDRAGRLWAAPAEGPLLCLDGDRFRPVPSDAAQALRIRALAEGAPGELWVGTTASGLWRLRGDRLELAALAPGEISTLTVDPSNRVWVGTRAQGLLTLEEGRLQAPDWARALPGRTITSLRSDRKGTLWIGMDQAGLVRRTAAGRLEVPTGAPARRWTVLTLLEDRAGALWSGSAGRGLQVRFEVPFKLLPLRQGEPGEGVRMVCQDASGSVWCLSEGQGLGRLHQDGVESVDLRGALGPDLPTALWPRRAGGLWIGTRQGAVFQVEGTTARRFAWQGGPRPEAILSLYEDPSGTLWISTADQGLTKVPPERGSLGFPMVRGVVAMTGSPSRLYLASPTRGLGLLEEGQVRWLGRTEGLGAQGVHALHLDVRGDLWVGTPEGLRLFRDGGFLRPRATGGPLLQDLHGILEDALGRIWLTTSQGLFRASRTALLKAMEEGSPVSLTAFDPQDGLPGREAQGGAQPTAWADQEGSLYFATSRGLAWTWGRADTPPPAPLHLHLLRLLVDEAERPAPGPLSLEPGIHRLEVQYTGIGLTAPDKLRFRYRLEGLEPSWNEVGDRRFAIYPSLPPGQYRFVLQAWRPEEEGPIQERTLDITIRPFFRQTPLFWVLCGVGAAAFGWWLLRLRLQQIEARSAVVDERNRMAREIHDHLAQGFTGVLLQLEAAEAKLARMAGDPEPVLTRLDHARNLAASSLQEARRSVLALHPRKPEGADLLGALRSLADRLLAGTDIQVELAQTGTPRPLGPRLEEELLRMAQEALTNALRHGKARWVRVVLQYQGRLVSLSLEDDGRGFDPSADAAGYGMRSIRESLRQLKGRLDIDSAPGQGTRITLTLPIRRWRP